MIILISSEQSFPIVHDPIQAFFLAGLDLFHVRKYQFTDEQMRGYLGAVPLAFRPLLVLHSHYHLAREFGLNRLHFSATARQGELYRDFDSGFQLSTSVHGIEEFNALESCWNYAFFSPVFPSISKKGYGQDNSVLGSLVRRENHRVKLIGLGGVDQENCQELLQAGADGIALMGAVWTSDHPLASFKAVYQHYDTYFNSQKK